MTDAPCATGCKRPAPNAVICSPCEVEIAQALALAASISGDLQDAVGRQLARGNGSGGSTSPEPPLPIDLTASDARQALAGCLMKWILRLQPAPGTTLLGIPAMAAWLIEHLPGLRQHYDAGNAYHQIRAHVDCAEAVVDRPPDLVLAGECPSCGTVLRAEADDDLAECPCGTVVTGLQARLEQRARKADILGPPEEISRQLALLGHAVPPGTISSWGTRGQIERLPGGMYRLKDALVMTARRGHRRPRMAG